MEHAKFWKLVEAIDQRALSDGDEEGALQPLRDALAELEQDELEGFEEELAQKLYALDGPRYAEAAGDSGESGDGFLYARCFVVARGNAVYDAVLADPSTMPKTLEAWCEGLLSVAAEAHEQHTGEEWAFDTSVSYETGSNQALWKK